MGRVRLPECAVHPGRAFGATVSEPPFWASRRRSTAAIIDLAGVAIEDDPHSNAADTDCENALHYCLEVTAIQYGVRSDRLDDEQRADGARLFEYLAGQARLLVEWYWPVIVHLAHRFDELGKISGEHVDVILPKWVSWSRLS